MKAQPSFLVELTLIPIAAILLLLTGLSAPSRLAAARCTSSAASLRLWLGRDKTQKAVCRSERVPRSPLSRTSAAQRHEAFLRAQSTVGMEAQSVCRKRSRPLFQTRFGIAGGAYRAAAPPSRAPRLRPTAA